METTPSRPCGRFRRWIKRLAVLTTMMVVVAAPTVYFGVPALASRGWARHRVEKALTKTLGTPVEISHSAWSWKEGLVLKGVSGGTEGTWFHIDAVRLKPDTSRLLRGKLRARAVLENPEIVVRDVASEPRPLRLPRLSKRGLRLDSVEVRNGTYLWESAAYDTSLRIESITFLGSGRIRDRRLGLEIGDLTGVVNGKAIRGQGTLSAAGDGVSGTVDAKDVDPEVRGPLFQALRAANITFKVAGPASEPF